jgi:hypothetical protein
MYLLLFLICFTLFYPSVHMYVAIDCEVVLYYHVKWLLVDISDSCLFQKI